MKSSGRHRPGRAGAFPEDASCSSSLKLLVIVSSSTAGVLASCAPAATFSIFAACSSVRSARLAVASMMTMIRSDLETSSPVTEEIFPSLSRNSPLRPKWFPAPTPPAIPGKLPLPPSRGSRAWRTRQEEISVSGLDGKLHDVPYGMDDGVVDEEGDAAEDEYGDDHCHEEQLRGTICRCVEFLRGYHRGKGVSRSVRNGEIPEVQCFRVQMVVAVDRENMSEFRRCHIIEKMSFRGAMRYSRW